MFMLTQTPSKPSLDSDMKDELLMRENAARLLARVATCNDTLKYINLKPHLFDLLCKELVVKVDQFEPDQFAVIHSILKVDSPYQVLQLHGQQHH